MTVELPDFNPIHEHSELTEDPSKPTQLDYNVIDQHQHHQ